MIIEKDFDKIAQMLTSADQETRNLALNLFGSNVFNQKEIDFINALIKKNQLPD